MRYPGDEARREAKVAQRLYQQPGRVAARPGAQCQRVLAGLDARLHTNDIAHHTLHTVVELHQEIHGAARGEIDGVEEETQLWPGRLGRHIGRQFVRLGGGIAERKLFGGILQEKVERIDHGHFRDQADLDGEMLHWFREDQAGKVIALRVLLPVDEVTGGLDLERVGGDWDAAVGCGPEANHLRRETYQAVILVIRLVMQRDTYGHESIPYDRSAAGSGVDLDAYAVRASALLLAVERRGPNGSLQLSTSGRFRCRSGHVCTESPGRRAPEAILASPKITSCALPATGMLTCQ